MKVILLEKIRNLGGLGDQVNVKAGYARNFLLPSSKAVLATKDNVALFETKRKELERTQADKLGQAQHRAEDIEKLAKVTVGAHASDEGKLFGSVGTREIANAITAAGVALEKSEVLLPAGTLRECGEHSVQIQLHADLVTTITVNIIADNE